MPKLLMLIGPPGCGKTTFRKTLPEGAYTIASSDDYIETVAQSFGKTYNDVFADTVKYADAHCHGVVDSAIAAGEDLLVDRTNLSVKSRHKVLQKVKNKDYEVIGVVFKPHDISTWRYRLRHRLGKLIPTGVIGSMLDGFEEPSLIEGFDHIVQYFS